MNVMGTRHLGLNGPNRRRRDKYVSRACRACQRRKSKCSGHDPCLSCQDRDLVCTYGSEKRRPRKSISAVQRRVSPRTTINAGGRRDAHSPGPVHYTQLPAINLETIEDPQEHDQFSTQAVHEDSLPRDPLTRDSFYRAGGPSRISLRSQLSEARALFKAKDDSRFDRCEELYRLGGVYPIELPAYSEIQDSLNFYFANTNRQYPAIHPENTMRRIRQTLGYLRYPSTGVRVDVDHVAAPTIALLCVMIAISEMTGMKASPFNVENRAMLFRSHARGLLQKFEFLPPSLEVLRCHTLMTIYLLHMNFLDLALQSSAVTSRLALVLHLHRQCGPPGKESDSYDQNLWWTIYMLDRDIACIGGTACLIRDEEIDGPRPGRDGHFEKFSTVTYISCPNDLDNRSGSIERECRRDATYLEVLAHLGRLWARIWDTLVTKSSESVCQWETTEILDAQIRVLQQRLPPSLIWKDSSNLERDLERAEEEAAQRQLVILMRINTLRLFLRRNPASGCTCLETKTPYCQGTSLASQTIEAIAHLNAHHEALSPIWYHVSTSLVQCILYLVNFIAASTSTSETEFASASVVSAYRVLINLSGRCVSARNAVEALDAAFSHHNDGLVWPQVTRSTSPTLPHRRSQTDGLESTNAQGPGPREKRNNATASTKQNFRADDIIGCLQRGYESLDDIVTNATPNL